MKKELSRLIAYISYWLGACDDKSPYQFTLVFDYDSNNLKNYFYFESEENLLRARYYLKLNGCSVRTYLNRECANSSEAVLV